jgi:DNA-binding HxlR family transcriptional regulator
MIQYRSQCPVTSALDVFGDRWTLIVLRSIFAGQKRFGDLLKMPEGISTNILADRLALLQREAVITATPYQTNPHRYEYHLTEKGADLLPVLRAMAAWSLKHVPDRWTPPRWFEEATIEDFYPREQPEA